MKNHIIIYFSIALTAIILLISSCGNEKISLPWEQQELPCLYPATDIHFISADTGFICTGDDWTGGEILQTIDGGLNWEIILETEFRLSGMDMDREGNLAAIGYAGNYAYRPSGGEWTTIPLLTYHAFSDIAMGVGHVKIIVAGGTFTSGIINKIDISNNVISRDTFETDWEAAAFANDSTVVVCGYGGIMKSNDLGSSWELLDINGIYLKDIQFPSTDIGYACGYGGSILKSTNAGSNWSFQRDGDGIFTSDKRFNALHFKDEDNGILVGLEGLCWITDNGGSDWQVVKNLPKLDYTEVHIINNKAMVISKERKLVIVHLE